MKKYPYKSLLIIILFFILSPFVMKAQFSDSVYSYSPDRKYGFGGGMSIGGGYTMLTGNLSKYHPNHGTFSVAFNFLYGKISYDLFMYVGNVAPNEGYTSNEYSFISDSINQALEFENTFGYMIVDRKRVSVNPYIGINLYHMNQNIGNEENIGPTKVGTVLGCAFDYKFSSAFFDKYMGDFILGTRVSYRNLQKYAGLDVSNLNVSFYFKFMIRSYRKDKKSRNNIENNELRDTRKIPVRKEFKDL